jgi:transposase
VKFPHGLGTIRYAGLNVPDDDANLMGGRIWRQGEDWYLSTQWRMAAPKALPETGRAVGVKIAASVILTTVDSDGRSRQVDTPREDKRRARRYKLAGRKLSRRIEAQKKREAKAAARSGDKVRLRRSKGFYEASARLAKMEAADRNKRDDQIHKETRKIVDRYARITVQEMDVASMMKKADAPDQEGAQTGPNAGVGQGTEARAGHASGAQTQQASRYGAHASTPNLQGRRCRTCAQRDARVDAHRAGLLKLWRQHPEMADGKPVMRCETCGTALDRRKNAAINELHLGAQWPRRARSSMLSGRLGLDSRASPFLENRRKKSLKPIISGWLKRPNKRL